MHLANDRFPRIDYFLWTEKEHLLWYYGRVSESLEVSG